MRGRIRAESHSITLGDRDVKWPNGPNNPYSLSGAEQFPGLSSLLALEPQLFTGMGETKIVRIIAFLDTSTKYN